MPSQLGGLIREAANSWRAGRGGGALSQPARVHEKGDVKGGHGDLAGRARERVGAGRGCGGTRVQTEEPAAGGAGV